MIYVKIMVLSLFLITTACAGQNDKKSNTNTTVDTQSDLNTDTSNGTSGNNNSSGGSTFPNVNTSCQFFLPDNDQNALSHINSDTAVNCRNGLANLQDLYRQFASKTCSQMEDILRNIQGPNGQQVPPLPVPNGTIYNALVTCANKTTFSNDNLVLE